MREPPGPCGAGRLRCVWLCGAGPLCVPVGGGPPARSPHASLRLGVVDLEARPGPATAHRHRGQALQRWSAPRRPPIGRCSLSVRCRPSPVTAHRHRGLAPQAPRRPPIGRGSLSVCCPPWPCRRPPAPRLGSPDLLCSPYRPNRLRMWIGYCDMDRL